MHQNAHTDPTYMWVQFKFKRIVFESKKNWWRGRINLFSFCDLNKTFIFMFKFDMEAYSQMKYELDIQYPKILKENLLLRFQSSSLKQKTSNYWDFF